MSELIEVEAEGDWTDRAVKTRFIRAWWKANRDMVAPKRRPKPVAPPRGARFYGDGTTIHATGHVDVEIDPDGHVSAVWFRCQTLPFVEHQVDGRRAAEMAGTPEPRIVGLHLDDLR